MTDFSKLAKDIEDRIVSASSSGRLALQPELTLLLRNMHESGVPVPARLRNLDEELTNEAIEESFDNVPL